MDNGEIDHSSNPLLTNPYRSSSGKHEELKNTKTCTHTHTCNPPGPAIPTHTHTHTCYHTHTQVFSTDEDDLGELKKPRKKLLGNREAVKKYREKKKSHEAYLEEEVKKLRYVNQQLLRRLEGQAALEAEILRLKSLLVDLRAKIDAELGVHPLKKLCDGTNFGWEGSCFIAVKDCQINHIADLSLNLEIVNGVKVGGDKLSSASQATFIA